MKLSVVIQAGGESKRMGCDKGLVSFLGQPLIQRVVERVRPVANELLVTSNRPEDYLFLGVPIYKDLLPYRGALSGLYTAFSKARFPLVAVIACDMAFINPALLAAERDYLLEQNTDGIVPQDGGNLEPFHAVYRREPCFSAVKAALANGQKRVDSWFSRVNIGYFSPEQVAQFGPAGRAFINLNTPEELQQAEILAGDVNQRVACAVK